MLCIWMWMWAISGIALLGFILAARIACKLEGAHMKIANMGHAEAIIPLDMCRVWPDLGHKKLLQF